RIEQGMMLVELGVGFIRGLVMMIDALVIEIHWNKLGLTLQYVEYVAGQLAMNAERTRRGEVPLFIESPYDFLHMTEADWDRLARDAKLTASRTAVYANSLAFVLAHEVAHHVLGHTCYPPVNAVKKRRSEQEGDSWATQVLLKNNFSPVGGDDSAAV